MPAGSSVRATCRPLELIAGDHVHCRVELIEDRGQTVMVRALRGGMPREIEIDRELIVFIEEARPADADKC